MFYKVRNRFKIIECIDHKGNPKAETDLDGVWRIENLELGEGLVLSKPLNSEEDDIRLKVTSNVQRAVHNPKEGTVRVVTNNSVYTLRTLPSFQRTE